MSWRDDLLDGSFRGAPFKVQRHDYAFGRRGEVHEYALRDEPYSEDLGRAADRYRIECMVIGDDYMAERDALIAACRAKGPGTLIHPYLGSKQVQCSADVRVRESTEEGGAAFFELEFTEAGVLTAPGITEDTRYTARAAADDMADQAGSDLDGDLVTAEQPEFVVNSAIDRAAGAIAAIQDAIAQVADIGGQLKADFVEAGQALIDSVTDLVAAPLDLAAGVQGLMGQLRELAPTPQAAYAALVDLLDYGDDPPAATGSTPSRQQEAANIDAVVRFIRRSAAAELVRATAAMDFASYDEATTRRDDLADRLETLLYDASAEDEAYAALRKLRLAMVRDITARGGSLARLFTYAPPESAPALLIAHRLYGDALRDGDIITRNAVSNPCFVPPKFGLEVPTPDG